MLVLRRRPRTGGHRDRRARHLHLRPLHRSRPPGSGRLRQDRDHTHRTDPADPSRRTPRTVHLVRAARANWASIVCLRKDYMKHRPNVERVIAQIATWRGRRVKLRYRDVAKNDAWLTRRAAALNLRTLMIQRLTARDGGRVLPT